MTNLKHSLSAVAVVLDAEQNILLIKGPQRGLEVSRRYH